MKVRLLRRDTIEHFSKNHSNGKTHFNNFLISIKFADWNKAEDITKSINGNLLGGKSNRVVFDLGGNGSNAFRIIGKYVFVRKLVRLYILWIGTHEEYNALTPADKLTVSDY